MQRNRILAWLCLIFLTCAGKVFAGQPAICRYLTVSETQAAFTCGDQLWIMARKDGTARALPAAQTAIENPQFSPDGRFIAYSGTANDNTDVYVIPVAGGAARRLTWHPGSDRFRSWNGHKIIYSSGKAAAPARYTELYEIDVLSGSERKLPFTGAYGQVSPDSSWTAVVSAEDIMETGAFRQYRGGNNCRISLKNNRTGEIRDIPNQGWNDLNPVWTGKKLYLISDRDGVRNVYGYDLKTGRTDRLTSFGDFDVHGLSARAGTLAFEQGGQLFLLDLLKGRTECVRPQLPRDVLFPGLKAYTLSGGREVRSVVISPDGGQLAVDNHGDILVGRTTAAGEWRNLTSSGGVHEQQPAWGPGGRLAYLSDATGEYELIVQHHPVSRAQKISLGKGWFSELRWSPDGKKIALADHRGSLLVVDIATGKAVVAARDSFSVRNEHNFNCRWSPDGLFLVYQLRGRNQLNQLLVLNTVSGKTDTLTDGMTDTGFPVFDAAGAKLYFGACKENSLAMGVLDMSAFGRNRNWDIDVLDFPVNEKRLTLRKVYSGILNLRQLEVTEEGNLLFVADKDVPCLMAGDTKTGKMTVVRQRVTEFQLAAIGHQVLCQSYGDYWLVRTGEPYAASKIELSALSLHIDPRAEWRNAFAETLRLIRDFFQGSCIPDVAALEQKYMPWPDRLTCREDFKYLLRQLLGELHSSHVYFSSAEVPPEKDESIGLLGGDWETMQGHYRLKRMYHGDSWGSTPQNPLDAAGVQERDYLITVNGEPVLPGMPIESYFRGLADKPVQLGFSKLPSGMAEQVFIVTPLGDDTDLRRWEWVARNWRLVDSLSKGRAGYLYLPDTHRGAYQVLNRDYASQAAKEYLLIDARFNAGGYFPDYLVDLLGRRPLLRFLRNDAAPLAEPLMTAPGKMLLLVNQRTVSGGELLAAEFRQRGLGLLAGTRTAGLGNPYTGDHLLIDGTTLVLPTLVSVDLQGRTLFENKGLNPDVTVPGNPDDPAGEVQLRRTLNFLLTHQH